MKSIHGIALAALAIVAVPVAHAQTYGPEDDGRRFSDGSRVVCRNVEVQKSQSDPNRIAGTAAGAVIGGVLGHQVGGGRGRDLAPVGGAIAGGAVGSKIQGDRQANRGDRVVAQRCERVYP